jgi:hypothetical protein
LTFVAACADIFEIQFPVKVRNIYEYCWSLISTSSHFRSVFAASFFFGLFFDH